MSRSVALPGRHWYQPDPTLFGIGLSLMVIGLVAITSASVEYAEVNYGDPWFHATRHLVYMALACIAGASVYAMPQSFWERTGGLWLFLAVGLLVLVLIPGVGREVNGSQRWLALAGFTLQPSEFAKLALVVYLAGYLVRREHEVRNQWQGFLKPMIVLFALTLLLLLEPDFGATVMVVGTAFGMLFLAGVKLGHFLLVVLGSVAAMAVLAISEPYRMKRLTAYTDPWADPYDTGFHLVQSLIAFGRGEWAGVGLGNSVQKLLYLPEAHTDFVFAIWAEETGFLGVLLVIALYLALIGRMLWLGRASMLRGNPFGAHLCNGIAIIFAGQAFINMGVSSGLLPTKALALPLISYGGSSMIASCLMLGLLLRIERELPAVSKTAKFRTAPDRKRVAKAGR